MKAIAIIGIAALTALGLSACDNGSCKADGTFAAPASILQKGGGGGGGGGHASGGGGGHAGGEGSSGAKGGTAENAPGARPVPIFPFTGGGNSGTCKRSA